MYTYILTLYSANVALCMFELTYNPTVWAIINDIINDRGSLVSLTYGSLYCIRTLYRIYSSTRCVNIVIRICYQYMV